MIVSLRMRHRCALRTSPITATQLAQTRALLAHHLLSVFGVAEVRGEWRICGLVLPVLGDVRREFNRAVSSCDLMHRQVSRPNT